MTGEEIIQLQDLFKWAVISEDDGRIITFW